jgi:hypothetical protein
MEPHPYLALSLLMAVAVEDMAHPQVWERLAVLVEVLLLIHQVFLMHKVHKVL